MTAVLFWLAIVLGALWLVALVKPGWVGPNLLGTRNPITDKSKWMRKELHQQGLRFVQWSGWLVPLAHLVAPHVAGPMWFVGYSLLNIAFLSVGAYRLKRKWKLWQQLGYDGPPQLEQQALSLSESQVVTYQMPSEAD